MIPFKMQWYYSSMLYIAPKTYRGTKKYAAVLTAPSIVYTEYEYSTHEVRQTRSLVKDVLPPYQHFCLVQR